MYRYLLLLSGLLILYPLTSFSQDNGWQNYYDILIEEVDDEEEENIDNLFEQISDIANNPVNINAITREDLEDMYFFDTRQSDAIIDYVNHYGPIRSKAELMMIPFLDDSRRGLLGCLTFIGDMPQQQMNSLDSLKFIKGGDDYRRYINSSVNKGELLASVKVPFYDREGDKEGYTGYKYKHWLRYNYRLNQHIKFGAVASQDANEPFFYGKNKWGYDYYSAYLQLQKLGFLKNLVVGNYRMRTGLGLVLNNNFSFGKTFGIASLSSPTAAIRPHSSRSSGNFLQGAAATFTITRTLEATVFGSYRLIDATMSDDERTIKTISRTGYHRTNSELDKKNNASQTTAGLNIKYNSGRFHLGSTALWNRYSLPLKPYENGSSISQLYRRFYPTGQKFFNASVDYGYKIGSKVKIEGETATDNNGYIATINTILLWISKKLTLMGIQRYYPYQFWSTMGNSFSEGGANQDENGVYISATWNPSARLSIFGYTDIAYFQWPKYQATGSSRSFDNMIQASYKLTPTSSVLIRYRMKMREKDTDVEGVMLYKNEHRLRLAYNNDFGRLALKSQIDLSYCKHMESSMGGMISQTATYSMKAIKIACGASYFHTKDYDSRVYAYEQSTPYNLSFPSFFGKGCRIYSLAETKLVKNLYFIAKIGMTHYFDRESIGTGKQMINSSTQTDLELMLRWKI